MRSSAHALAASLVLALTAALAGTTGAQGPVVPLPDALSIHVSSSAGDDANDGRTPAAPLRSIRAGAARVRNGYADRLLLKCGDTFYESFGNWNKGGKGPGEPLTIGSYGVGPRPVVAAEQSAFNLTGGGELHDLAIVGLHVTAARRNPDADDFDAATPAGHGIRIVRGVRNLLIEDCRFDFFSNNLTLTGNPKGGKVVNARVRRCQILDAWSATSAHSGQGLYADNVDGLVVEECVFDHNGWNERIPGSTPNMFRHNLYISARTSGVRLSGNVISRGSSHGVQMRGGGVCEGNLFFENAIHCFMAGEASLFRGNVVIGGRDINAKLPRGTGLELAAGRGQAVDNIFAHKPQTIGTAFLVARGKWSPAEINAEFRDNVLYDWSGNGLEIAAEIASLVFANNDLQGIAKGRKLITIKKAVGDATFEGNRYRSQDTRPDRVFSTTEGFVTFEQWTDDTGDTSELARAAYPDAAQSIAETFLESARRQSGREWKEEFTAAAAVRRIRKGFGKQESAEAEADATVGP